MPNFFMIGAAKSGTTSLWHALRQHPAIYLSPIKEPHFFISNGQAPRETGHGWSFLHKVGIWRPGDYAKLFAGAGGRRAIGDASTTYLPCPDAAGRIHLKLPNSRIIAVLRHPADRAYSAYNFLRQKMAEPQPTFQGAMADQGRRLAEGWAPQFLHQWHGYYHAHLQPWLRLFPRERIRVFLYDDWESQPGQTLTQLFRFLEVDDGFQPNLERRNVTRLPRFRWFKRFAEDKRWWGLPLSANEGTVRQSMHDLVRNADTHLNRVAPVPLDANLRFELTHGYRDDILRLEQLLGRDLSHWLTTP